MMKRSQTNFSNYSIVLCISFLLCITFCDILLVTAADDKTTDAAITSILTSLYDAFVRSSKDTDDPPTWDKCLLENKLLFRTMDELRQGTPGTCLTCDEIELQWQKDQEWLNQLSKSCTRNKDCTIAQTQIFFRNNCNTATASYNRRTVDLWASNYNEQFQQESIYLDTYNNICGKIDNIMGCKPIVDVVCLDGQCVAHDEVGMCIKQY